MPPRAGPVNSARAEDTPRVLRSLHPRPAPSGPDRCLNPHRAVAVPPAAQDAALRRGMTPAFVRTSTARLAGTVGAVRPVQIEPERSLTRRSARRIPGTMRHPASALAYGCCSNSGPGPRGRLRIRRKSPSLCRSSGNAVIRRSLLRVSGCGDGRVGSFRLWKEFVDHVGWNMQLMYLRQSPFDHPYQGRRTLVGTELLAWQAA